MHESSEENTLNQYYKDKIAWLTQHLEEVSRDRDSWKEFYLKGSRREADLILQLAEAEATIKRMGIN